MIGKSQEDVHQQTLDGFEHIEVHSLNSKHGSPLPRAIEKPKVPPIKCQGIKTKLVPFICSSIQWDGSGRWIEPFVGSGVVLFNIVPERALVTDTNPHIIEFYRGIASGRITPEVVRDYLEHEGSLLSHYGAEHYYEIRERFKSGSSSLDFLFLNRACFNGLMRFNRRGEFNVPFCKKPERFSRSYVTKIVNQVSWVSRLIKAYDWEFEVADWSKTVSKAEVGDFVYADPPYSGRHADYYNDWKEEDSANLLKSLREVPAGFALSTWKQNKYRSNNIVTDCLPNTVIKSTAHFYHVGSKEELRNEMEEALIVNNNFAVGSE